ncbi:hypothetical protein AG1IA_00750 [Rhizoctonia solani AG-1 IA]|uniref:Uncharacterized protein n=1 Tax=Thanatephorus cucumeris (strain AG1-IA) TaxID=983506 RepID=L8X4J2_THACA|nr:hypothetical protein AG1IA_00750 [Rhizoctonia solani AG-1 IA]
MRQPARNGVVHIAVGRTWIIYMDKSYNSISWESSIYSPQGMRQYCSDLLGVMQCCAHFADSTSIRCFVK